MNNSIIGDPQARAKAALAQQVHEMACRIYERAAVLMLADPEIEPSSEECQRLARDCAQAARDFYEGNGLAVFTNTEG